MSQKDYIMELVEQLRKKSSHLRGLAKTLQTNQTTMARKLQELGRSNVVDFRREGKNKAFFLKNSIEAREHLYIAEHYKLLRLLQKHPAFKQVIQGIKAHPKVGLALLFGSYAKGTAGRESDIDIYLETTSRALKKELEFLDSRLSIKIGRYLRESPLIREIEKDHVIIKGVELYYEKNPFFS
jgi:predicted nucleotidyltransferase